MIDCIRLRLLNDLGIDRFDMLCLSRGLQAFLAMFDTNVVTPSLDILLSCLHDVFLAAGCIWEASDSDLARRIKQGMDYVQAHKSKGL